MDVNYFRSEMCPNPRTLASQSQCTGTLVLVNWRSVLSIRALHERQSLGDAMPVSCVQSIKMSRMVLVKPAPFCHPVTTTTGSPLRMKPRALPILTAYCTRSSTSWIQTSFGGTASYLLYDFFCQHIYVSINNLMDYNLFAFLSQL